MKSKVDVAMVQASCILMLLIGPSSAGVTITTRACPEEYRGGDHVSYMNLYRYDEGKRQCAAKNGVLPMPTQESWLDSIRYAKRMKWENDGDEGIWIGVTVTKSDKTGVIFTDGDNLILNDADIESMLLSKNDSRFLEDQPTCIVFFPSNGDNGEFQPQDCVSASAYVVCRCLTNLKIHERRKLNPPDSSPTPVLSPAVKSPQKSPGDKRPSNESAVQGTSEIQGRSANGGSVNGGEGFKQDGDADDSSSESSVNSTVTIIAVMLSVCLVATAYFIVKSQHGKRLRDRISRQMPYNRSQTTENGGSSREGRLHSEDSSGYHRPIHVYEEILARNATVVPTSSSPMISNGFAVDATLPRLPPPEPPTATFVEIHDIRPSEGHDIGYMRPSFNRPDGIPGDVRSPPPTNGTRFDFHSTPTNDASTECLLKIPEQQHLKYASVETVQTLLDGDEENDEEYFVDEECEAAENGSPNSTCGLTIATTREPQERRHSPEFLHNNRNSVANPYVDIKDFTTCSPPPLDRSGEYANERFLRTVMKVAPKKPRRTMKHKKDSTDNPLHQVSTIESGALSQTSQDIPLYSEVRKETGPRKHAEVDIGSMDNSNLPTSEMEMVTGYTPMGNNQVGNAELNARMEVATYADIPEVSVENGSTFPPHDHHYEPVQFSSKQDAISNPVMLSTTNAALAESSLVCYEIPPEEYAD